MAPLRLAALGLLHESNTFARVATDMAAFERAGVLRGEQIRADIPMRKRLWRASSTYMTTMRSL